MLGTVAAAIVVTPVLAQQPSTEREPPKKDPLRFSAFAVQMQNGGMFGVVDITVERWTTDAERQVLSLTESVDWPSRRRANVTVGRC